MIRKSKLFSNCEEVTSYIIQPDKLAALPFFRRMEISLHTLVCVCCKNFKIQSAKIDKALTRYFADALNNPPFKTSEDFKKSLQEKLK